MVYIEEIVMTGFKSYGKKTVRMPMAQGFTAIVGPNGSGKSNAVDAINFCLGSLSSKSMRTGKLTDLLYSGLGREKPAEKLKVEIIFDNSDFAIPVKEKSVIVTRELGKNGQSVYRLNGKRTTRGDILDKMRIAGIDCVNGYNIIQQGQVGEIVGMSRDARRELLENIAGVSPFDAKKDAALAELSDAKQRLGELHLLISEVNNQLETVKKEKNVAEKWLELDALDKKLRSEMISYKMYNAKRMVYQFNQEIDDLSFQIDELKELKDGKLEKEIRSLHEKIDEKKLEIDKLTGQSDELNTTLGKVIIEEAKIKQNIDFNDKTILDRNELIHGLSQRIVENQKKVEEELQKLKSREEEISHKQLESKRLKKEKDNLEDLIREKEAEYEDVQIQYDEGTLHTRRIQDDLTKETIQMGISQNIVDGYASSVEKKETEIQELEKQMKQENDKILSLQQQIDDESSNLEEAKQQYAVSDNISSEFEEKVSQEEVSIEEANRTTLVLATKLETILTFMSRKKGEENPATSTILRMAAKKEINGVIGELKSLLDTEIPPVIAHLDGAIVTVDTQTVVKCLQILKEKSIGTADFIPLDQLGMNPDQTDLLPSVMQEKSELVDNIEEAAALWNENKDRGQSSVIVTNDGDTFLPNGVVTGGFFEKAAQESVQYLKEEKKTSEQELKALQTALGDLKDKQKRVNKLKTIIADNIKQTENSIHSYITDLQVSRGNIKHFNKSLGVLKEDKITLENQLNQRLSVLDMEKRKTSELEEKIQQIEQDNEKIKKALEAADPREPNAKFREIEKLVSKEDNELADEQMKLEIARTGIQALKERSKEIEERIEQEKQKKSNVTGSLEDHRKNLNHISMRREEIENKRDSVQKNIDDLESELSNLQFKLQNLNRDIEKTVRQITSLKDRINSLKIKRERADTELVNAINESEENDIAIIPEDDFDLDKRTKQEIFTEINSNFSAKKALEPINLLSIEEYVIIKDRHKNLIERRNVIQEERQVIIDFISQVEIEKRNVFMKLFNSVNKHFNSVFGELSQEGRAKMILENAEEPLESGVMIEVSPEGKKVKSLESLSGGEKALTALAFIFAVQQVEAQPFYVLDEIDAALDPMNVDRVGKLVHRLSRRMSDGKAVVGGAQFLVISHRDILMAKSDRIYGVTSVQGLSEMFPVKMADKTLERLV